MVAALRAGPGHFPVGLTLSMAEMEAIEGGESQYAQALEHLEDAYIATLARRAYRRPVDEATVEGDSVEVIRQQTRLK